MKKIGIITLNSGNNYGNRLQNYALQRALESIDCQPCTLVINDSPSSLRLFIRRAMSKLSNTSPRISRLKMIAAKEKNFKPFSEKMLKTTVVEDIDDIVDNYDYFITGSDQVWNPHFIRMDDTNFLSFAPKDKRISYAASFGVSEIPDDQKNFFRDNIRGINHISVREQDGVRLVKDLAGGGAKLVPDPTMLLNEKQWSDLLPAKSQSDKKYIFIYFLRGVDPDLEKKIKDFAADRDLEIYRVMGDYYDADHKTPDPLGFVAGIKHAEFVFTDSFHACVFSIIMKTPFKVYGRKDMKMSSRIETLLQNYHLEHAMSSGEDISFEEYDFSGVEEIRKRGAEVGFNFLKSSLK
ncbi:hypothetical protein CR969_01850 [Candidatus Saccharibacteria bacterium]|nr:MAG: hypothetical protein CR969_01850 [Candidatus Saccharibacteria bacterium]